MPPPPGYSQDQLPLGRISYRLGHEEVTVMCSYKQLAMRFPRKLCELYIQKTKLVPSKR